MNALSHKLTKTILNTPKPLRRMVIVSERHKHSRMKMKECKTALDGDK